LRRRHAVLSEKTHRHEKRKQAIIVNGSSDAITDTGYKKIHTSSNQASNNDVLN